MSKMDSFWNLSPWNTTVSRKVISFSDISSVKRRSNETAENRTNSSKTTFEENLVKFKQHLRTQLEFLQ